MSYCGSDKELCKVDINITVLQREVLITLLLFARDNEKYSMLCHRTGGGGGGGGGKHEGTGYSKSVFTLGLNVMTHSNYCLHGYTSSSGKKLVTNRASLQNGLLVFNVSWSLE